MTRTPDSQTDLKIGSVLRITKHMSSMMVVQDSKKLLVWVAEELDIVSPRPDEIVEIDD